MPWKSKWTSLAVSLFLLLSVNSIAGDPPTSPGPNDSLKAKPLRYAFTINSAMLFCSSCNLEGSLVAIPTTIHGIQYKEVRIGAGIGYSSSGPVRTMPYFGSVTYNLFGMKRKNRVFVEFNYGGAHAWALPVVGYNQFSQDVKAWGFLQASTGYAFHYYKLRIAVQAGFQKLKTRTTYTYGNPYTYSWAEGDLVIPPQQRVTDHHTNRFFLSLSVGI